MVIIVAIDEKERSKQAVTIAYDLATSYDDDLVALHVVPMEDYSAHKESIESIPEFSEFSMSQEAQSAERFAKEFVTKTISDVDKEIIDPRGRVGDVANEILEEAADVEPRYLVISGRRRSPAGKAIFGNTAQKILLNADCPVVTKLSDR